LTAGIAVVRGLHGALTLMFLSGIGIVYNSAITRRRGPLLAAASGALLLETVVITANRGVCPLETIHHAVDDDRPFFEPFMPKPLARAAVPVPGGVTAAGYALLALRR
jgi:hypothetical protein